MNLEWRIILNGGTLDLDPTLAEEKVNHSGIVVIVELEIDLEGGGKASCLTFEDVAKYNGTKVQCASRSSSIPVDFSNVPNATLKTFGKSNTGTDHVCC